MCSGMVGRKIVVDFWTGTAAAPRISASQRAPPHSALYCLKRTLTGSDIGREDILSPGCDTLGPTPGWWKPSPPSWREVVREGELFPDGSAFSVESPSRKSGIKKGHGPSREVLRESSNFLPLWAATK